MKRQRRAARTAVKRQPSEDQRFELLQLQGRSCNRKEKAREKNIQKCCNTEFYTISSFLLILLCDKFLYCNGIINRICCWMGACRCHNTWNDSWGLDIENDWGNNYLSAIKFRISSIFDAAHHGASNGTKTVGIAQFEKNINQFFQNSYIQTCLNDNNFGKTWWNPTIRTSLKTSSNVESTNVD